MAPAAPSRSRDDSVPDQCLPARRRAAAVDRFEGHHARGPRPARRDAEGRRGGVFRRSARRQHRRADLDADPGGAVFSCSTVENMTTLAPRWLVSRAFDLTWFFGGAALSLMVLWLYF